MMIPNLGAATATHAPLTRTVPLPTATPLRPQDLAAALETRRAVLATDRASQSVPSALRDIPAALLPPDPKAPAGPPPAFDSTPLEQLRRPVDEIAELSAADASAKSPRAETPDAGKTGAQDTGKPAAVPEHIDLIR